MLQPDDLATVGVRERAEQSRAREGNPGIAHNIGLFSRVGVEPVIQPELPLAIDDYALIGDCATAALVGRNGSGPASTAALASLVCSEHPNAAEGA
jgi:hypothetical protein